MVVVVVVVVVVVSWQRFKNLKVVQHRTRLPVSVESEKTPRTLDVTSIYLDIFKIVPKISSYIYDPDFGESLGKI